MNNKKDAEKTESQLLKTFDYAWNRGMNGERRPGDIHQKVTDILPRIFKFTRTRPTFVSQDRDTYTNDGTTCGVALGHGSICTRAPVDGRKRCPDHKGMKVNAFIKPGSLTNSENTLHLTCGVALDDGSTCIKAPVFGRERCEEHKGMRINRRVNIPFVTQEKHLSNRPVSCEEHVGMNMTVHGFGSKVLGRVSGAETCAAVTLSGSSCRRKAGKESKFCWQHLSNRRVSYEEHEGMNMTVYGFGSKVLGRVSGAETCAAVTLSGSLCRRKAGRESNFCWQHDR